MSEEPPIRGVPDEREYIDRLVAADQREAEERSTRDNLRVIEIADREAEMNVIDISQASNMGPAHR